jgi:hypothetical protein
VWTGAGNFTRSPDRPFRNESLSRPTHIK